MKCRRLADDYWPALPFCHDRGRPWPPRTIPSTREIAPWYSDLPAERPWQEHVIAAMSNAGLPVLAWHTTRSARDGKLTIHIFAKPELIAALDKKGRSRLRTMALTLGYWGLKIKPKRQNTMSEGVYTK
jgi:hypothetical protein